MKTATDAPPTERAVAIPRVCRRCSRENDGRDTRCSRCGSYLPGAAGAQLVHGSRSPAIVDAVTAGVLVELTDALAGGPGLEARYMHSRELCARAISVVRIMGDYLDSRGWHDSKGRLRPEVDKYNRALATAERWLAALAATPSQAGRLGADLSTVRRMGVTEQLLAQRAEKEARLVDTGAGESRPDPAAPMEGGQVQAPRRAGGGSP